MIVTILKKKRESALKGQEQEHRATPYE